MYNWCVNVCTVYLSFYVKGEYNKTLGKLNMINTNFEKKNSNIFL